MCSPDATFADDVAAVRAAIDGPTVLCGHSYGGVVIGAAAASEDVRRCVFLCAFALLDGEGMDGVAAPLRSAMRLEGSTVAIDPSLANEAFYGDVHPDLAAAAITRLRPMSGARVPDDAGIGAWRSKPSTYVVCTQDQSIEVEAQRAMAGRCDAVEEWDCSHSPMLSKADEVATLLRRAAG